MQFNHSGTVTSKGGAIIFEYTRDGQTRDIYYGCWHTTNCVFRMNHARDNFPIKHIFQVDIILKMIEISSKDTRKVESSRQTEDCQCTDPEYKHWACCKLSTFCPFCDSLEKIHRYCDSCSGNRIVPLIGSDTFYARDLFKGSEIREPPFLFENVVQLVGRVGNEMSKERKSTNRRMTPLSELEKNESDSDWEPDLLELD